MLLGVALAGAAVAADEVVKTYQDPAFDATVVKIRVRAVESTAFEKQNVFGVIDGIAKALTAQLRRDRLIE